MYHLIEEMVTFIDIISYIGLIYVIFSVTFTTYWIIIGPRNKKIIGNCNKCNKPIICPPEPTCILCAEEREITKLD